MAIVKHPLWLGTEAGVQSYPASGISKAMCRTHMIYEDVIGVQSWAYDTIRDMGDMLYLTDLPANQKHVFRNWTKLAR